MDIESQFWKLCDEAVQLDTGSLDARAAERPRSNSLASSRVVPSTACFSFAAFPYDYDRLRRCRLR